jgi:hypothetical protein
MSVALVRAKSAVYWILWIAVILAAVNVGRQAKPGVQGLLWGPPAKVVPHTVVLRSRLFHADGSYEDLPFWETVAVRSDGSSVTRHTGGRPGNAVSSRLILLRSGKRIETDDIAETKTTEPVDVKTVFRQLRDPATDCSMTYVERPSTAPGTRMLTSEQVGSWSALSLHANRSTTWFVKDLGCAVIKSRLETAHGTGGKDPISSAIGEPDPTLFAVPDRYTEAPPSTVEHLPASSPEGQAVDRQYNARRNQK